MTLESKIETLPRTSKPLIAALKRLGILTIQDLLLDFPYRYLDFTKLIPIKDIHPGENISLKVKIKSIASRFSFRGRMSLAEAVVSDDTGSLKVVWFNQAYLAKSLKTGDEIFLAGAPEYYNFGLQLTNPIYEKVSGFPVHTARLVPLYHLIQKIYPKTFRNLVAAALPLASQIKEILPENIIGSQNLLDLQHTIELSHFPTSEQDVLSAKKRLAFEEIFFNQLSAQQYKLKLKAKASYNIPFDQNLIKQFVDSLPFQLTADQKKAAWEILQDLQKASPMNRLLEGDVGSGKTLVALIAALQTTACGLQTAFLAPTEILAKQHFETAKKYLSASDFRLPTSDIPVALLTNSYSLVDKKNIAKPKLHNLISEGMPGLYFGTHALLQKKVKFKNLALVIIDEQHRFGVEQRAALLQDQKKVPHLLSLSATPIPRSLQLAFYGELDISRLKTKPAGRKPIATRVVDDKNRGSAYEFIKKQIHSGRQVFVITPLIEESDRLGVKSVKTEMENLKKIFPQFSIGLLHGRLKGAEKERTMNDFLANQTQILVATSVVEVGMDVPNASVMVIEGAERFGLAQLHQFRGRVGRAEHQSYCLLFTSIPSTKMTSSFPSPLTAIGSEAQARRGEGQGEGENELQKRLQAFCKTQDGFALAELDLKLRGFGEIYGQEQSGWNFKYFDPSYVSLIPAAREEALKILQDDLELANYPLLKEKIKDRVIHFE
jgi:ATP-dependent DNA helicase RecG